MMKTEADYRVWGKKKKTLRKLFLTAPLESPQLTSTQLYTQGHNVDVGTVASLMTGDKQHNTELHTGTMSSTTLDCRLWNDDLSQNRSGHFWLHRRHWFYTCMTHWLILRFATSVQQVQNSDTSAPKKELYCGLMAFPVSQLCLKSCKAFDLPCVRHFSKVRQTSL